MDIIACIENPAVIEVILAHLADKVRPVVPAHSLSGTGLAKG